MNPTMPFSLAEALHPTLCYATPVRLIRALSMARVRANSNTTL